MLRHQLRQLFSTVLTEFLAEEVESITTNCSEQMLCGRLAMILERRAHQAGFFGYKADVEYNRNYGGKLKTIIDEFYRTISIRCDVILHSRGVFPEKDNLIAIEMKKTAHSQEARQSDRERLKALTRPTYDNFWDPQCEPPTEHVCGYELGYLVVLSNKGRSVRVEEYERGECLRARRVAF